MAIDREKILKQLQEMTPNAQAPQCPEFLNNEDLFEDAFKEPVKNANGECEPLPAIFNDYGYGKYEDGTLFITLKSASLVSNLYSKYLDEEALVWDSNKERLLLYVPDPTQPKVAFKGSSWQFAKRLNPEHKGHITLRGVYNEIQESEYFKCTGNH